MYRTPHLPNNLGFSYFTWRMRLCPCPLLPLHCCHADEKCNIYRTKSALSLGDAGDQIFRGVSVYEEQHPERGRQNGKFAWKGGEKEGKEPQMDAAAAAAADHGCCNGRGRRMTWLLADSRLFDFATWPSVRPSVGRRLVVRSPPSLPCLLPSAF